MSDLVLIEGLAMETVVGVYDWERRVRQSLRLDVELRTDLRAAGGSDRLEDTIDYKAMDILGVVYSKHCTVITGR